MCLDCIIFHLKNMLLNQFHLLGSQLASVKKSIGVLSFLVLGGVKNRFDSRVQKMYTSETTVMQQCEV